MESVGIIVSISIWHLNVRLRVVAGGRGDAPQVPTAPVGGRGRGGAANGAAQSPIVCQGRDAPRGKDESAQDPQHDADRSQTE